MIERAFDTGDEVCCIFYRGYIQVQTPQKTLTVEVVLPLLPTAPNKRSRTTAGSTVPILSAVERSERNVSIDKIARIAMGWESNRGNC